MILAVSLGAGRVDAADEKSKPDEARHHFEEGTAAFNMGEFARAADEYRDAYRLKHEPAILYNIAQAYRLANNPQQAIFFYRSYLRSLPDAGNREEVEGRIRKLESEHYEDGNVPVARSPQTSPQVPAKPDATATTISLTPALVVATAPRRPQRVPVYKKWWLWTAVGLAAAGVGVGIGFAIVNGRTAAAPGTSLGTSNVF
jgi:tetratricopeptide (TPR) repeat protein